MAVSVDPPEASRGVIDGLKLPFSILSDQDGVVIREYGLVHAKGGPAGEDVAIPAAFLIDRGGEVVWRHVSRRIIDRADPQVILSAIQGIRGVSAESPAPELP